ncbi:MAG: bifunctional folylpolyglutamate synthase/dihydrofolate synthase [Sphaerochaetaceae bacterium]|nr:bifunctional folylpolyglutamate synthase/dihydrofolate synthase [Sphaerochaetaceae bacterium]
MEFETFDQVVHYMESFTNLEKKTDKYTVRTYRLDRMQALMERLGNPQESYKTIHVAGSKGKGSTASYIASGLEAAGFVTGLYMSPHVSDYRERFTRCGAFIDDAILIATGNKLACMIEGFHFCDQYGENEPTTFELYTAFAFMLFKEIGCQWAVIETGLGGRLDATNILKSEASVLTPIELEHTDILGDTIAKIAGEKAKIIKAGRPVFCALQNPEALAVFQAEANEKGSPLYSLSNETSSITDTHVTFTDGYETDLDLAMAGLVQAQNCALALLVLRTLGLYVPQVTECALMKNALPGRMERVSWDRTLYLDGAHTQNSMAHLLETFRKMYPTKRGICIFGAVAGKNHEAMTDLVLSTFDSIVVCRPGTFKKSDPEALYQMLLAKKGPNQCVVYREDAADALSYCLSHTETDEPVLACGSFYLAGVIKEALCH